MLLNDGLQVTELPFFATKVRLGRGGAEEVYQLGPLNEYERYKQCRTILRLLWRNPDLLISGELWTGLDWRKQRKNWQRAFRREFPSSINENERNLAVITSTKSCLKLLYVCCLMKLYYLL